ncbi:type IX secretion system sortase PorU [candidate division KSB1 bacterium]|nr:type IX secretion system sortase PorU [candidate division KSB1 bacterium]
MRHRIYFSGYIFILIFILGAANLIASSDSSVRILSTSNNELTIEFIPKDFKIDTIHSSNKPLLRFKFESAQFTDEPNKPFIPFAHYFISIPVGAQLSYKILEAQTEDLSPINIAAVPSFSIQDEIPVEKYIAFVPPKEFSVSYPSKPVEIGAPGFLRNYPIVPIKIFPVQVFAKDQKVRIFKKLTIQFNFLGIIPNQTVIKVSDKIEDASELILNPHQARNWRAVPAPKLMKQKTESASGLWLKIPVKSEGIYKLTGAKLFAHGINIHEINPATFQLFNNGGFELPEKNSVPRPDSLIENAIIVSDGNDSRFDSEDYILFYARGTTGYQADSSGEFSHYKNHYSEKNIYWLTWGGTRPGKRVITTQQNQNTTVVKNSFTDFLFVEEEQINLLHSGRHWLGRRLKTEWEVLTYAFSMKGALSDSLVKIRAQLAPVSEGQHNCFLSFNNSILKNITFAGPYNSSDEIQFKFLTFNTENKVNIQSGLNYIKIGYQNFQATQNCFVDWIEISYTRQLIKENEVLFFNSAPDDGILRFELKNQSSEPITLLDLTEVHQIRQINYQPNNEVIAFVDSVSRKQPKRYVAFSSKNVLEINEFEKASFAQLREKSYHVDYLIITPFQFLNAAHTLKSLRENIDTLKVEVVNIADIFNEFGWGLPDPMAIRDFLRFVYENSSQPPQYVLLLGHGHYDYKNILGDSGPNWIPTYQNLETNSTYSVCSDDIFACVNGDDDFLDMSIGRIPARTSEEAEQFIRKICQYEAHKANGDWQNQIALIADDEFIQGGADGGETFHTLDCEKISNLFPEHFDQQKIYLVNYPAVLSASISGITKPKANQDLIRYLNEGVLVCNMIGHSNETQFAHEKIFSISREIPLIQNHEKLPFLIVASCAFGRYDAPANRHIIEELLFHPAGGIIASFASARVAFPGANAALNQYLVQFLFPSETTTRRLGDASCLAKNRIPGMNSSKYHLLGDPALVLNAPDSRITIQSVIPDSFKALSLVTVKGQINSFETTTSVSNGKIFLKIFDTQQPQTYISGQNQKVEFILPGNIIFRGTYPIINNEFEAQFVVPKDITYGGQDGRISCFYGNENSENVFAGFQDGIYLGGTHATMTDMKGPTIKIEFKDCHFFENDFVPPNPVLLVTIQDSLSGINLTGEIGHKITLIIDQKEEQKIDLTPYFHYDLGSYRAGKIQYQLLNLAEGEHTIEIKAWDNFNNSTKTEAKFCIIDQEKLVVRNLLNYPNPFADKTNFTFEINQPAEIDIKIYTVAGRMIRTFSGVPAHQGFNFEHTWDGTDEAGEPVANGVYLFQFSAKAEIMGRIIRTTEVGKMTVMK